MKKYNRKSGDTGRKFSVPYSFIIIFLVACSLPARSENRQPVRMLHSTSQTVNLSKGVSLSVTNPMAQGKAEHFFREHGVAVHPLAQSKSRPAVVLEEIPSVPGMPETARNGYIVHLNTKTIRIGYTSARGLTTAFKTLDELYRSANSSGKKLRLPQGEAYGWDPENALTKFRYRNEPFLSPEELALKIEQVVPAEALMVEFMLTHPSEGWLIKTDAMSLVNSEQTVYRNRCFTYTEIAGLYDLFNRYDLELIPVFDLTADNRRFREVTGHEMLSVEGFRFVRALLDEFFSLAQPEAVTFVVPDGKYRAAVADIAAAYPFIHRLTFVTE